MSLPTRAVGRNVSAQSVFDAFATVDPTVLRTALEAALGISLGGSGLLQKATVTLTDAQIKVLPGGSGLLEVVAAPGANKMLLFMGGVALLDDAAGIYGGIDDADSSCAILLGDAIYVSNKVDNADFSAFFASQGIDPTKVAQFVPSGLWRNPIADSKNKALNLTIYNNLGALTGGNAANTLKVTVYYVVADV